VYGQDNPERGIQGVLIRIVREDDNRLIASALTDHRGEALVVVPGIPFNNFVTEHSAPENEENDDWLATGNVVEKETSVRLEAVVDETLPWPVDPEALEANHNEWLCEVTASENGELANSINLKLKTGQTQIIKFYVNVPVGT